MRHACGYLSKFRHGVIRIRADQPDYSDLPEKIYDWDYSVHKGAKEELPDIFPTPRGKAIRTTSCVDANLMHDILSGRSMTGILHLFNCWKCLLVQPQVSQSYCFTIAMDHGTKGCMDGSMIQPKGPNYNASSPV